MMNAKRELGDLAIFGGRSVFDSPRSTSNLVRPDVEKFLDYSRLFYAQHQYTNNGPLVTLLEKRLAEFHQAEYCIAFCSGFWALALVIKALALKGRTEMVMPSLTYRRMADIAAWANLKPRFCEVDSATLALDACTARACVTENTALILAAHPIVNCCDVSGLESLSRECGIPLLFDSVESVYESVAGGRIGGFGAAEVFSMHASKLLNGFEGGYVTTNDPGLAENLRLTRGFGFSGPDHISVPGGINAKLNEVHAAMGLASLDDIEDQVRRNRQRYNTYQSRLAAVPGVRLLEFDERYRTSYKNIVIELLDGWPLSRKDTLSIMNAEKMLARAYYHPPLHRKRMRYPHVPAELPLTDALSERFVLMPCGHMVSDADIDQVVALLEFMHANAGAINGRLRMTDGK